YVIRRPWASCIAAVTGSGVLRMLVLDPWRGTVREFLLLPHRHPRLDLVDEESRAVVGFGAVRRGDRDRDARFARRNEAGAMPDPDPRVRPAAPRLLHDSREFGLGHFGIGRVLDAGDVAVLRGAADG